MITAEYTIPGLHVRELELDVPLDWAEPDGPTIRVFARELVAPQRRDDDLPLLVYLQGGPGGKSPRPVAAEGWIGEALRRFRVVLLDQRGTGRSTPLDGAAIAGIPPAEQGAYLAHFRADSIVRDAEAFRTQVYRGAKWTTLGQSYGGFLTLTYLSLAPHGLAASLVTGGLASVTPSAAEVYRHTGPRVERKNRVYRERFPHDVPRIHAIADRLAAEPVLLPDGDTLTVRRFQSLGLDFGMGPGFERVHWLIDEAFAADGETLTDAFLADAACRTGFVANPLFAVLQESIYGHGDGATAWAAQAQRDRSPQFSESARPLLFTGEMIYPWMFREIRALRPFERAAEQLAARESWPPLYDLDRLAANEVPVIAAVYFDDMYVDSGLQLETANRVGAVHAWVTNEFEHDGIGTPRVLPHLLHLLDEHGGTRR